MKALLYKELKLAMYGKDPETSSGVWEPFAEENQ